MGFSRGRARSAIRDYRFILLMMAIIIFVIKLAIIEVPSPEKLPSECIESKEKCGFVFDEAHYVPAVRKIMRGEPANNEHPPLSKALFMLGIYIFGDRPLGWRFFPALAGSLNVLLVGLIAYRLTRVKPIAYSSALLYATDVMTFNISSIAILDAPSYTFLLLGALLALDGKLLRSSLALGAATSAKASTVFGAISVMVLMFLDRLKKGSRTPKDFGAALDGVAAMLLIASLIFISSLAIYDYSLNAFESPFAHLDFMLRYHSGLKYECSYGLMPLYCVNVNDEKETLVELPLRWAIPVLGVSPSSYYVVTVEVDGKRSNPIAYYGVASPLWWVTWLIVAYSIVPALRFLRGAFFNRNSSQSPDELTAFFVLSWFAFNYLVYFPIAYLLSRWVYSFYFVQTLPAIAIGASWALWQDKFSRIALYGLLAVQVAWFVVWFPVKPEPLIRFLSMLGI